jgi:hypothetical protein
MGVATIAVALALYLLNRREPLAHWMFWRFAGIYGLTIFFGLACFSAGHLLLSFVCARDPMLAGERLLLDIATGTLIFALGTFLVGVLHGLGGVFFWAFPSALILAGAPRLVREGASLVFRLRRARAPHPPSLAANLAVGLGAVGLLLVYLPLLTIDNIAFDARWYHLAIAEHYVTAGRIAAFAEGWHLGAIPHLASWLYTWAMSSPVLDLHGRIELASHMEFLLFVWTLAGVPLLVARLTGRRVRGTWACYFLFPGLFLYDSNLSTAADHVLAFWAIPIALAAHRFVAALSIRRALVLAIVCAGAALTKVQSAYLLAPTAVYLAGGTILRVYRRKERLGRAAFVLAVPLLGGFLLLTASHWLSNAIWYKNPVFPFLADVFPSRPWRSELMGNILDPGWTPVGSFPERIAETLLSPFKLGFVQHDWWQFHRDVPLFGFLFTLSLALLPFVPRSRRTWILAAGTCMGVMIWFWTYHQDRYLQGLLPWMVAVTASVFVGAWATGFAARIGIAALVAVQLIYGGDTAFLPPYTAIDKAVRILSSTFRGDTQDRFDPHTGFGNVAAALPKDSVVLLHLRQLRLGIGRPVVTDNPRWTSAPLLGSLEGPQAAWRQLRDWGVTHLLFSGSRCEPEDLDLQSELATHFLAHFAGERAQAVDGKTIVSLSQTEPSQTAYPDVLYAGCGVRAKIPWRAVDATYAGDRGPSNSANLPAVDEKPFADVTCAVVDDRCPIQFPAEIAGRWTKVAQWKQAALWLRRPQ